MPVHFHMDRKVPPDTFVKDCSMNESMTRWITIHGTQGVLLARNVGWKSIGHGFFIEDGTETDNKFYANIGVLARAGVAKHPEPAPGPGHPGQQGCWTKSERRSIPIGSIPASSGS